MNIQKQSPFPTNKFINLLMIDGKKSIAVKLFYDSLFLLKHKKLKGKFKKTAFSTLSTAVFSDAMKDNSVHLDHNQRIGKQGLKLSSVDNQNTSSLNSIKLNNDDSINVEMSSLLEVLAIAIENVTPSVELKKVRRAGNTFLIPAILSQHKANTLAMRWIIDSARKKQQGSSQNFSECLADEIYQAYLKQGKARQKRDELHSAAITNRANIRYRWW